jgi:hypothetical protein
MTARPERHSFHNSPEWLDARYKALKRARGFCSCCGCRGEPDNPLQVDHIQPRSQFPRLALVQSNLQVLCRRCNLGKSNKDMTDWRFEPSRELAILANLEPTKRFRLQQLGWLKLNGDSAQIRSAALREYRALWREIEAAWIATQDTSK